ncbi:MAG: M20/M25/M40 family metallo-hydrolase [Synergistaceae bacterium]|jgi:arginine utilization protein RocB|nr:M20/M25/M40 family metallo-hydrolase [Synergistaceae bacterium]
MIDEIIEREDFKRRVEKLLTDFVGIYTSTGTKREKLVDTFYKAWFDSVNYFKSRGDSSGFFEIPGDPFGRTIPWCFLKGTGRRTVVLLHHYDVVDTDDYGALRTLATSPDALMSALREGKAELDREALDDLRGGEWLFGRGAADMKGGAAIQMALIEAYANLAEEGRLDGNIVLLGLPDEENLSSGGRGAPLILKKLKDLHGFDYALALNSEPTNRSLGPNTPKLFVSSIGKVLPLIYARGALAHVGWLYDGLSPIKIMAEVVRRLDENPLFIDEENGIVSTGGTFLYLKDGKDVYDVSLPISTAGLMNVLFLKNTVGDIIDIIKRECAEAFDAVIADQQRSYDAYMKAQGKESGALPWRTNVKLYSELYGEALRDSGEAFTSGLGSLISGMREKITRGELNMIGASRAVVEHTLLHVKDRSPVIVIALVPPYYPHVSNAMLGASANRAERVCDSVIAAASERYGDNYVRHCATGMSDFSYFLRNPIDADTDYIKDNMLLWGDIYSIPFAEMEEISMPILNIGPWGKGIHTFAERVFTDDLYRRAPHLLALAIDKALGDQGTAD